MSVFAAVLPVFFTVFFAELGDKTQLATVLFASGGEVRPMAVFLAASAALVLSTGLAVFVGVFMARYVTVIPLQLIAGVGFIVIGAWTLYQHFTAAS
ncbi:TMEM165/GDT1 family protein [Pararhodospirillum oryzae]|uniref:GDT1 family protein n=1 Tax=Pararhodospirillum oryzae TaxID=478448 RepID=A0A512H3Q4_9PROT|nr:TMEM165/GDT1 family protein [Pararhodospirillum oryzae]GEO80096.1 UPF0016 family membrane protein [Pararhodospirillum oryzae]